MVNTSRLSIIGQLFVISLLLSLLMFLWVTIETVLLLFERIKNCVASDLKVKRAGNPLFMCALYALESVLLLLLFNEDNMKVIYRCIKV